MTTIQDKILQDIRKKINILIILINCFFLIYIYINIRNHGFDYLNLKYQMETTNPQISKTAEHISKSVWCTEKMFREYYEFFVGLDYKYINKDFVFPEKKYPRIYVINVIVEYENYPKMILEILR